MAALLVNSERVGSSSDKVVLDINQGISSPIIGVPKCEGAICSIDELLNGNDSTFGVPDWLAVIISIGLPGDEYSEYLK